MQIDLIDMRHRPDGIYKWIGWTTGQSCTSCSLWQENLVALNMQNHVLAVVGVRKILNSDNRREFVNEIVENVVKEWPGEVTIVNGRP